MKYVINYWNEEIYIQMESPSLDGMCNLMGERILKNRWGEERRERDKE